MLDAAMKAVYEKHGMVSSNSSIRFGDNSFDMKITVGMKDAIGSSDPKMFKAVGRFGFLFGVDKDSIGKEFKTKTSSKIWKFVGLSSTGKYGIASSLHPKAKITKSRLNH